MYVGMYVFTCYDSRTLTIPTGEYLKPYNQYQCHVMYWVFTTLPGCWRHAALAVSKKGEVEMCLIRHRLEY